MGSTRTSYLPAAGKVVERTGKSYPEWFSILDRFDVRTKGHKSAAAFLQAEFNIGPWWAQNVVVEFERAIGLRQVNQTSKGFGLSVTRTVACTISDAWRAFEATDCLNSWFTNGAKQDFREGGSYENGDKDRGTFLRIVPHKRLRFTWENPEHCTGSEVEIEFRAAKDGRTTIVLNHGKLKNAEEVAGMREGWSWAMDSLRSFLETGKGFSHESWIAAKRRPR